jgi:hypothetical protein
MRIPAKKANKFHNISVTFDGYKFDSKAEKRRYDQLKLQERAGEIKDIKVHPRFLLQEAFRNREGKKLRAIYYFADFQYVDLKTGETVVEDVKGARTKLFQLKSKWFQKLYPQYKFVVYDVMKFLS